MIALYFHYAHRESTRMIVSLRKWQSIVDLFVLKISQSVSLLQRQSIDDLHVLESVCSFTSQWSLQYSSSWSVETSLVKKKKKITHNNNLTSNQQNNHSKSISKFSIFRFVTLSTLSRNLFVSLRFVNVSTICLFQRHSMSSLQRLMNLFQWNFISEFASTTSKAHAFDSLHFRNQHQRKWIYYIQRYESKWHKKMKNNNQCESITQSIQFVFFAIVCSIVNAINTLSIDFLFLNLQSISTRRLIKTRKIQIRKVWNSIRSRNRYRFAVSVFVLLEKSIVSSY